MRLLLNSFFKVYSSWRCVFLSLIVTTIARDSISFVCSQRGYSAAGSLMLYFERWFTRKVHRKNNNIISTEVSSSSI